MDPVSLPSWKDYIADWLSLDAGTVRAPFRAIHSLHPQESIGFCFTRQTDPLE